MVLLPNARALTGCCTRTGRSSATGSCAVMLLSCVSGLRRPAKCGNSQPLTLRPDNPYLSCCCSYLEVWLWGRAGAPSTRSRSRSPGRRRRGSRSRSRSPRRRRPRSRSARYVPVVLGLSEVGLECTAEHWSGMLCRFSRLPCSKGVRACQCERGNHSLEVDYRLGLQPEPQNPGPQPQPRGPVRAQPGPARAQPGPQAPPQVGPQRGTQPRAQPQAPRAQPGARAPPQAGPQPRP